MSWEIILLGVFVAGGWYWYAGMRVREQAIAVGRRACGNAGLQFLDESVALGKIRFARNSNGQLQFQRVVDGVHDGRGYRDRGDFAHGFGAVWT